MELRRAIRTFLSLTPTVAGVTAVSVAGLMVARGLLPVGVLRDSGDSVGNYLQTVGGIYAVLMAFVVYVVWGQFNDARGYVARYRYNPVADLADVVALRAQREAGFGD